MCKLAFVISFMPCACCLGWRVIPVVNSEHPSLTFESARSLKQSRALGVRSSGFIRQGSSALSRVDCVPRMGIARWLRKQGIGARKNVGTKAKYKAKQGQAQFDGLTTPPALRPKRIILVRHGECEGNVNRKVYATTPDWKVGMTPRGFQQAAEAGHRIRELVGNESVQFFISPYVRTRQTMAWILKAFEGQTVFVNTEPRLRKQDFGNLQEPEKMASVFKERQSFGRFYFRFPNGEAGTDVYDRMASFIPYMFKTMNSDGHARDITPIENYVIVSHGLLMRFFCMCYFRWTVEEFEQVWNPRNAEIWVLEKQPTLGTYAIAGRLEGRELTDDENSAQQLKPIRFGANQSQPLCEYMKVPVHLRVMI